MSVENLPSDQIENEEGQITCPNCGANFSAEEPRCPYCSAINPAGAEKAYMDKLDDIREDTDDLAETAEDEFEADLKRNSKRTVAIVVAVVAALALLFLAVNCMGKNEERHELEGYQAREAFRTEHFEELDRLYETGDDDALSAYAWSLTDDPGFDALFSWKHIGLLEAHDDCEALRSIEGDIKAGTCDFENYTWSVSLALRLGQLGASDNTYYAELSQDDEKRAVEYRAYARQFLQNALQMSEEEVADFAESVKDEQGYIQEDELKQALKARLKQLGTLR